MSRNCQPSSPQSVEGRLSVTVSEQKSKPKKFQSLTMIRALPSVSKESIFVRICAATTASSADWDDAIMKTYESIQPGQKPFDAK